MNYSRLTAFCLALGFTLLSVLVGCDTSLQAFDEDTGLYSISGVLTLSKHPHYVRINDLNDPASLDSARSLDATVTLENVTEGTSKTLTDSVVTFDGTHTHNFRIDQDIQPEATYRLTVERSDGATSRAVATMPPVTDIDINADEPIKCLNGANIEFNNVPDPRLVEMSVGVPWNEGSRWVHDDVATETGFVVWRVLDETLPSTITSSVARNRYCRQLQEDYFYVAYTHYGPSWPTDSVRTSPVASTVENGLGLFGGLHRDTLTVRIDTVTVQSIFN